MSEGSGLTEVNAVSPVNEVKESNGMEKKNGAILPSINEAIHQQIAQSFHPSIKQSINQSIVILNANEVMIAVACAAAVDVAKSMLHLYFRWQSCNRSCCCC